MRKTKLMQRIEERYQQPLERFLPQIVSDKGLSAAAVEFGVSKGTLRYWLLTLGIGYPPDWRQRGEKEGSATFDADLGWFAQHKDELMAQYEGQFVAILEGRIVDSDQDFSQLAERVYQRYGYREILMPRVEQSSQSVLLPSPIVVQEGA